MLESMSFNSHSRKPEADQIREKYALVQEAFPVTARSPSLPLPPSLPPSLPVSPFARGVFFSQQDSSGVERK